MGRFMSHEGLAQGLFNNDYNGASSSASLSVWRDFLGNSEETTELLADRMLADYKALAPKMRKHYQASHIET